MTAEPITYGRLAEAGRRQALAASHRVAEDGDGAIRDAVGLVALLALIGRHARFLGQNAGRGNVASALHHRVETVLVAVRPLLPEVTVGRAGRWMPAARTLGAAHDLLAAQLGPRGEPRGPDAVALRHPAAVTAAVGRLVGVVWVVLETAERRAGYLREHLLDAAAGAGPEEGAKRPYSEGPRALLRTAQALDRLGWLRAPLWAIESRCGAPGRLPVLDEVIPLLGDRGLPSFELDLERLRHAVHTLTYPGHRPHHRPLVALAALGVAVSGWSVDLVSRYAAVHDPPRRVLFTRAARTAGQALAAWQTVDVRLRPLRSLGFHGRDVTEAADQVYRGVEARARASVNAAALPAGLHDVRRVVLLLPELAAATAYASRRLAAEGQWTTATGTVAHAGATLLAEACAEAVEASRHLVSACAALPGPQPLPGRAALLADPQLPTLTVAARSPRPVVAAQPTPPGQDVCLQDPRLGVLTCDAGLFERALRQPDRQLWELLRPHAVRLNLTGTESRPTLAALAARLAPQQVSALASATDTPQPPGPASAPGLGLDADATGPPAGLDLGL